LTLISCDAVSQNKVSGIVIDDIEKVTIPGAIIEEIGTANRVVTNQEGVFQINTLHDTCTLSFSWIGYSTKTIKITNDTSISIVLELWDYKAKWITIGTSYEVVNSVYGISISNGMDEKPLIHFEDLRADVLYKIDGQTDFNKDYSLRGKLSWNHPYKRISLASIEYLQSNFNNAGFIHKDINLSGMIGINWAQLNVKIGYQELNSYNNFGPSIGFQKSHYKPRLYYGFLMGYYFDYFTYNMYLQGFIYKNKLSLRLSYDRIEEFDFINVGFNYTFDHNNNR
jgi:hypothetical protein